MSVKAVIVKPKITITQQTKARKMIKQLSTIHKHVLLLFFAGGGWYNTTIEYTGPAFQGADTEETVNEFGWHFGGGVELPLGLHRHHVVLARRL